jgi:hypothetical protein
MIYEMTEDLKLFSGSILFDERDQAGTVWREVRATSAVWHTLVHKPVDRFGGMEIMQGFPAELFGATAAEMGSRTVGVDHVKRIRVDHPDRLGERFEIEIVHGTCLVPPPALSVSPDGAQRDNHREQKCRVGIG